MFYKNSVDQRYYGSVDGSSYEELVTGEVVVLGEDHRYEMEPLDHQLEQFLLEGARAGTGLMSQARKLGIELNLVKAAGFMLGYAQRLDVRYDQ